MYDVDFAGLKFSSPLVGSAGTVGYGHDLKKISDISFFGGLTFKTITPKLREGAPFPRVCETEVGLINAIGLQNDGWQSFVDHHLPQVKNYPHKKIVSIAADNVEQFAKMVRLAVDLKEIDIIELNISCPNIDYGGKSYASDKGLLKELLNACVEAAKKKKPKNKQENKQKKKPIMVKLSPHMASIGQAAQLAEKCGVDALSMINTLRGLKIDVDSRRPLIHNVIGGYSGLGIKPIALAMIYEASQATKLPILGIGGIMTGEDVVECMLAGATLVGVGTANMIDPGACKKIFKEFSKYLAKHKTKARDLIGAMLPPEKF